MLEKVKSKLKELEKQYDYWLELYDRDGLRYQNDRIMMLGYQINILKELLEGSDKEWIKENMQSFINI